MASADAPAVVAVIVAGTGLLWFFVDARGSAVRMARRGLAQQVTVVVHGGYDRQPSEAIAGLPRGRGRR
jgi:hypothetical protein